MSSSTVVYCNACPAGNKTLKRVECVYHLACSRIKLADLFCSHSTAQVLLWRIRAVPTKFFSLFVHQDERELLAELTHALFCCDWWPERFPGERFHPPSGSRQPPPLSRIIHRRVSTIAARREVTTTMKKVVVHIVSDSHRKINSHTLSVVAARRAYRESIVINVVDRKPVAAHIYEYTTESTSPDA